MIKIPSKKYISTKKTGKQVIMTITTSVHIRIFKTKT